MSDEKVQPKIIIEQAGKQEEVTVEKLNEMKNDHKVKVNLDESKSTPETQVYEKKDLLVE